MAAGFLAVALGLVVVLPWPPEAGGLAALAPVAGLVTTFFFFFCLGSVGGVVVLGGFVTGLVVVPVPVFFLGVF